MQPMQQLFQQRDEISGYTPFIDEPSPCRMSLVTSDFNSSPESVVTNMSGPVHTSMEYTDYRRDPLLPVNMTQQEQETSSEAAADNGYYKYSCERYRPETSAMQAGAVDYLRFNPDFTTTQTDCMRAHHRQLRGTSTDERFKKDWRPSLLNTSSSTSWEDRVDLDLKRCITGWKVSGDFKGALSRYCSITVTPL